VLVATHLVKGYINLFGCCKSNLIERRKVCCLWMRSC